MNRLAATVVGLVLSTSPLDAQELVVTITVASASIHKAPTTASPVLATAPRGKSFAVTRELGSWVAIPWPAAEAGVGFVHVSWGTLSHASAVEARRTNSAPLTAAKPPAEPAPERQPVPVLPRIASTDIQSIARQPEPLAPRPVSRVVLPSHVVGVGGRLGTMSLSGFAGTSRLWFAERLGAQLELGRATHTSAALMRMQATNIGVHVIASLSDVASNHVWVRPYVGGGINVSRSSLHSTSGVSLANDTSRGYHALGGAELTWANAPQLAVSAELRHSWMEAPFSGFETGGLGLGLAAHWYVK